MAITTIDGLVAAFPGQSSSYLRTGFTPQTAGNIQSLWLEAGIPGTGAAPTSSISGDVPVMTTPGAIVNFANPTGGNLTYLARIAAYSTQAGILFLYDRLVQTGNSSGISATSTAGQTVNTTAITRPDANGAGVEAWWQVYVVMGAGSTNTITLSYTDQDGNSGATATTGSALPTTLAVGRSSPFRFAAGDTGVRSVQTWTNSASMTSGTIGLVLRRLVTELPIAFANGASQLDGIAAGLPRIYDSACLELLWMPQASAATAVGGQIVLAQG